MYPCCETTHLVLDTAAPHWAKSTHGIFPSFCAAALCLGGYTHQNLLHLLCQTSLQIRLMQLFSPKQCDPSNLAPRSYTILLGISWPICDPSVFSLLLTCALQIVPALNSRLNHLVGKVEAVNHLLLVKVKNHCLLNEATERENAAKF